MQFENKDAARRFFHQLNQTTKDWNRVRMDAPEFADLQKQLETQVAEVSNHA